MKKSKLKCVLVMMVVVLLLLIYIVINAKDTLLIDQTAINVMKTIRSDFLTTLFKYITYLGNYYVLLIIDIIVCSILVFKYKNYKLAFISLLSLCIAGIMTYILKIIIVRPRPEYMLIKESGYSFPSGHTLNSTALYGFISFLIYKNIKKKKFIPILVGVFTIVTVGLTRIYLNVHYLTDVLGGLLIGTIHLIILINLFRKVGCKYEIG